MKIEDEMQFHAVHRLRPRDDGKPRSIIARFERRKDRDLVLQRAPATLKDTSYRVNEQLPMEIIERRNELWPIYKREKKARVRCGRKSGGIVIIYKKCLEKCLQFLKSDCEFVQWIKFSNLFKKCSSLLIGCIYLPPENSKYNSPDAYLDIEAEMLDLFDTNMQYFLIGDFNSRVGVTADFVEPDDNLFDILKNNNCQLRESIHVVDILRRLNIPLSRCSEDKGRPNSLGLKLINFCKDNGIFILNGRVDKDANCGKKTCKNASLIDYAIASPELFSYISEFEVFDFNPLFSDVHCRLHVLFDNCSNDVYNLNCNKQTQISTVRWVPGKVNQYIECVENYNEVIADLINEVERLDVKKPDFQTDLDNIVDKINSVFIDSAADTFGQTRKRCSNANTVEQPWFNSACNAKRKSFHAAKKKYNCIKNKEMHLCLRQASADYKKELDKAYKDYEFRTENIIRETTSNDPNKLETFK
ncbi:unnamed protein product [Mytilus coruscus]|nr:unnamed protein product [Mytilus coruscus]